MYYDCDHATRTQVVAEFDEPTYVAGGSRDAAFLGRVTDMLDQEIHAPTLGADAVVDHLVEILLVQLVRAWIRQRPDRQRGTWLGWVGDDLVRRTVETIHGAPGALLTTASLARTLHVSRATLERRFSAAMGITSAQYVTQWRMDLAARRLRETTESVGEIATAVGYRSVPSFIRAFTRDRQVTPAVYRRRGSRATEGTGLSVTGTAALAS